MQMIAICDGPVLQWEARQPVNHKTFKAVEMNHDTDISRDARIVYYYY
jgi:hypothetical protein